LKGTFICFLEENEKLTATLTTTAAGQDKTNAQLKRELVFRAGD